MVDSNDPRVKRTKQNLKKSLVVLMQHYKVENISVQKITQEANVTRGTFYLHYHDKQDFIDRAMDEILDDFFDNIMIMSKQTPDKKYVYSNPVEVCCLDRVFNYLQDESMMFGVLLNSQEDVAFSDKVYDRLVIYLNNFREQLADDFEVSKIPNELQVSYVASAKLGFIKRWLRDDMIYTPHYVAKVLKEITGVDTSNGVNLTHFFVENEG